MTPDQAQDAPLHPPTRSRIDGDDVQILKQGGWTKADLKIVDVGQGPLVVKDFAHKTWWVRLIGRFQISRECAAYRWMGALPGVPRFAGRIDRHSLAVEHLAGEHLGWSPLRFDHGPGLYARLRRTVDAFQGLGIVHLDLRAQENVLVREDHEVFVIDFASALRLRPGGLAHRLLFRRLRVFDESAMLKWKQMMSAGPLTPDEERFLRRFRFWRSLWVFNLKGARRRGKGT